MRLTNGLCLLSSGFDSPVALYLASQSGLKIDCIYFANEPVENSKVKRLVTHLSKTLQTPITLYIMPHFIAQRAFREQCHSPLQCVFCKRMMFRIASSLAQQKGYDCLVTGDNLGQVASQTAHNMAVIDKVSVVPVIRPLLCFDKQEIINLSQKIGTYDISVLSEGPCPYLPGSPVTKAKEYRIKKQESYLDIQGLSELNIRNMQLFTAQPE